MRDYPTDAKTIVIKAQKGTGKTFSLESYIKKNDPDYIVFISFRRSLSNELLKRLSKYNFENYLDRHHSQTRYYTSREPTSPSVGC